MALYSRRQRDRAKSERVERGESIPLTEEIEKVVRTKIVWALMNNTPAKFATSSYTRDIDAFEVLAQDITGIVLEEWGVMSLTGLARADTDLVAYLVNHASTGQVLDVLEAFFLSVRRIARARPVFVNDAEEPATFRDKINDIFDDANVAYQLVGEQIVSRDSMATHANIVAPALSLLHGRPEFNAVERAFQDALAELKPNGDPADAITDAGTALQEMLSACGASGNALGPLLADARKQDLLGPYDSKLAEGVELIGEWLSADRSNRGDAHSASSATRADGWLAVHVAGALIVRLEQRFQGS